MEGYNKKIEELTEKKKDLEAVLKKQGNVETDLKKKLSDMLEATKTEIEEVWKVRNQEAGRMRKIMKKRVKNPVYKSKNPETLKCLWNEQGSVYGIPQEVQKVPSPFALFKMEEKGMKNNKKITEAWGTASEKEKATFEARHRELAKEQEEQLRIGAIVVID